MGESRRYGVIRLPTCVLPWSMPTRETMLSGDCALNVRYCSKSGVRKESSTFARKPSMDLVSQSSRRRSRIGVERGCHSLSYAPLWVKKLENVIDSPMGVTQVIGGLRFGY